MAETLTEREQQILEHLKQAEQLGSTLTDYARAFNVNVSELYNGKAQLTRKGFWTPKAGVEPTKAELVAVQVTPDIRDAEGPVCRLNGPGGWIIECSRWPEASWIAALMGTRERAAS